MLSLLRAGVRFPHSRLDRSRLQTTQLSFQRRRFSSTGLAGLTVDEFCARTSACRCRTLPSAAPEYLYVRFPRPRLRELALRGWSRQRNRCSLSQAVSVPRIRFPRLIPLALVASTSP